MPLTKKNAKTESFRIPKDPELLSQKDRDILLMSPIEAGKAHKMTPQQIYSRKNSLYKVFGKNFKPGEMPSPPENKEKSILKPKVQKTKEVKRPFPLIPVDENSVEISFGDVCIKLKNLPPKISVDRATNSVSFT